MLLLVVALIIAVVLLALAGPALLMD